MATIQPEEIKMYKSEVMLDTSSGGGRMSSSLVASGVRNNIFPDVLETERVNGSTKYRKVFFKVENAQNTVLADSRVYLALPTTGEDYITMFEGTQTDTQADLTGSERNYGGAQLVNDLTAGDTQLVVEVEHTDIANEIFQTGDSIWIGGSVDEELHENITVVSVTDKQITIQLQDGDAIQHDFTASDTHVSSLLVLGDIGVGLENFTVNSTNGTYDNTNNPIQLNSVGTVFDNWTITFTSDSDFTCEGEYTGNVGSGYITADFSPDNPDFSTPYFTIPSAGWGGTFAANDTVTFTTIPAAKPVWLKRVVVPGMNVTSNMFRIGILGKVY